MIILDKRQIIQTLSMLEEKQKRLNCAIKSLEHILKYDYPSKKEE